jgi:hypothetical protein
MANEPNEESVRGLYEELKKITDFGLGTFVEAGERMSSFALQINKTFGQGRQRMVELMAAVADTVPNVNRLGGSVQNVSEIIQDIAEASRRNVVANVESVEKLYAASQLLGQDAQSISDTFLDIGVGIEKIPKQLEDAMEYVRSIGGNTKQVMKDVTNNMEQMNRFQFENGIVGLTKMAAQASMLRFNMAETFRLADKVLDPEGAVEVASAFQRLGVSAGNLVDPFQLMNQSINDPSGLQESLANISKQFTYFDEKTKTFKINPQGVLTLRELEKQTGVSASEMTKMGLAAAELDKRLSAVSAAGLKIATEEDKQFLANIAKMGEGGEYEVKITDDDGREQTKKLSEITQSEFDKLIKEQKEGPKTLEDLSRSQLNLTQILKADVEAIRNKILYGVVSAGPIRTTSEGAYRGITTTTGELSRLGETKDVRKEIEIFGSSFKELMKDLSDPNKNSTKSIRDFLFKVGGQFEKIQGNLVEGFQKTAKSVADKQTDKTGIERKYADLVDKYVLGENNKVGNNNYNKLIEELEKYTKSIEGKNINKTEIEKGYADLMKKYSVSKNDEIGGRKITDLVEGMRTAGEKSSSKGNMETELSNYANSIVKYLSSQSDLGGENVQKIIESLKSGKIPDELKGTLQPLNPTGQKSELSLGGNINVKVNLDNNNQFTQEQLQKILTEIFNSQKFQELILNISTQKNPYKPTGVKY